jgi:cold shock protein
MKGTIKRIVSDKFFGFIETADMDKDVFFHGSAVEGMTFEELREGMNVTFEAEEADRGPKAVKVTVV